MVIAGLIFLLTAGLAIDIFDNDFASIATSGVLATVALLKELIHSLFIFLDNYYFSAIRNAKHFR